MIVVERPPRNAAATVLPRTPPPGGAASGHAPSAPAELGLRGAIVNVFRQRGGSR